MKKCEVCNETLSLGDLESEHKTCKKCRLNIQKEDMSKLLCPWMTSGPKQLVYCKLGECMTYMETKHRAFCVRLKALLIKVGC